jgi:phenylpropionate dioxygenase-like ring-hydroxylating dioxygenase large terminal subunit
MARLSLTESQGQELQRLARHGRDARPVRRAQGLLWLDLGEHPVAIAQRLGVTREAVYSWPGGCKGRVPDQSPKVCGTGPARAVPGASARPWRIWCNR